MITYILILSNTCFGLATVLLIRKNVLLKTEMRKVKDDRRKWELECEKWKNKYTVRVQETLTDAEKELQAALLVLVKHFYPKRNF